MSDVFKLWPARAPFVDPNTGLLTSEAVKALGRIATLFGGQNNNLPVTFVYVPETGTPFGIVYLNSSGELTSTLSPEDGQILIGASGDDPVLGNIAGTSARISVTNGPGTIAINIDSNYAGQNTITTLGTISSGIWNATTISAGYGGTGQNTYTTGDILYASSSSTLAKLSSVATGSVLISGGLNTAPSWGKVGLTTHVSGNLPVNNLNSGTSASASTFWCGDATWKNPLPQALTTTSDPTFNSLTLTNGFGCNGATPQTEYTVNAAISATAGAVYTATEQGMLNDLKALTAQLRALLIANGQAV